ncbi:glucan 1,3-beta-glucosidase [Metschnikowia bicuspidata var. bicuspidata NRRL YB-4993]|uniref:Glucan 1,3-beta-glucosidase n=1 Tax=Metschnikowia bicuspidata var. bicuspidata NRRL YB-4993 TaxID=869754 RepID=A0A1A0H9Q9_9ASCO|nr:glucan 1,3-beta-glucosidase [Metschnikowia bicuspidata var. bicuspidata NRRL YB-4993]OBA20864.1 glucan 1,3-beta-glucosidase [Metschnikowia bicuspidata var. bicuspidata NRRL YB-4993]
MYQTRSNFGANLGSVFLREKWIYPSFFKGEQKTEFDIISSFKKNKEKGRREMEAHWTSYFLDEDWVELTRNKVNSLRLPIGFWNIDGGKYTTGTIFEEYSEMYRNSWLIIKSHYIVPAARRGISILIDVHGVPGGANDNDHSGAFYGGATFWTTPSFQELFIKAAVFVFEDLKEYDNISGILLINEASYNFNLQQQNFYAAAINAIREKEKTIPVVISDGWNADSWIQWVSSNQNPNAPAGIVVDHHVYRTFTDKDKERSADEIIADLNHDLLPSVNNDGNDVDFMVGEWSSVMDGQTWARTNGVITPSDDNDPRRRELVAEFNSKQTELFRKRASTGSYFWTYKFESGYGGEWDFRQQLGRGFEAPQVSVPDDSTFKRTLARDYTAHKNYWDSQYPNGKFEHERYKEGFVTAWEDGVTYAKAGALVGRKHAIKSVRLQEHLQRKGYLENIWEWKQGFDKGLEEFNKNAI